MSAPAYAILSDVLNNDSSPPGILVHLIGNSVGKAALEGINATTEFSGDSLLAMANVISALALTEEGIGL